jgi:hypothetical protein
VPEDGLVEHLDGQERGLRGRVPAQGPHADPDVAHREQPPAERGGAGDVGGRDAERREEPDGGGGGAGGRDEGDAGHGAGAGVDAHGRGAWSRPTVGERRLGSTPRRCRAGGLPPEARSQVPSL